ncbi:hypothetical protein BTO18_09360 [Polaribacter porphyrae]|uniref:Glyoxalase-like domain-containing protein n=2 Tax=Polaribacter porphyrae TaxID=1137780 RepID=A0A2S7WP30_9FLAO|nr:hypothetical protein BTO18_09360 [Polaribacter porphyrae]
MTSFSSCKKQERHKPIETKQEKIATDLKLDHFNIWTNYPQKAKQKLIELGFTAIPDSLSRIHHGQGTTGRYFYFLNTYLEFIYVYDKEEFTLNNKKNTALDFKERVNFENNGASPFSIALKVKDYKVDKIPFEKIEYHQEWMAENMSIYAAKNSKLNLKEPSVFVVYPEIETDEFETYDDLVKIPEEYKIWRTFFKHPNGAKKVTKITITSSGLNDNTATIKTLNTLQNISVKSGEKHLMEVYFDNKAQGKKFDLRPEIPLIIYL